MSRSFFTIDNDAELSNVSANFSARISVSPETYGLTPSLAAGYAQRQATFAASVMALGNPQTKTSSLVFAKNDARRALVELASDLAAIIRGTPGVTDEQRMQLGLSVRKTPAPLPEPGTPDSFTVALGVRGDVELKWKCDNPSGSTGTMYRVRRRIDDADGFEEVGITGRRRFIDTAVPAGSKCITYQVQGVRSTKAGPWGQFTVRFGKELNQSLPADTVQTKSMPLAA
jgi:hypothetical protein